MPPANPSMKDVVERHRGQVMSLKGVVGIAAGLSKADPKKRCIQVYVTADRWPAGLARQLDGFEVELVRSRGFRAT